MCVPADLGKERISDVKTIYNVILEKLTVLKSFTFI